MRKTVAGDPATRALRKLAKSADPLVAGWAARLLRRGGGTGEKVPRRKESPAAAK
jgi:hypothetical protein